MNRAQNETERIYTKRRKSYEILEQNLTCESIKIVVKIVGILFNYKHFMKRVRCNDLSALALIVTIYRIIGTISTEKMSL